MSRRGASQQRRWPTWGWVLPALLAAFSFSACIDDVVIPECLLGETNTCQAAAGGVGASGSPDGAGGDLVEPLAGQATGGALAESAGAGQAGAAPDTCACTVQPEFLTPACAGKPYQMTLLAGGGRAPYSWKLTPQPAGWSIAGSPDDPNSAVLRADAAPDEATDLTLVVTDARNTQRTLTLSLKVRTTCWFAYTSLEETGPELRLLDPLAEVPSPAPLAHATGAYDFEFSPDGAFLAYRYGVDAEHPKGRHLSLVDLTDLKEHDVGFGEDQVLSYAWSASSAVLAAAFEKDGQTYLGASRPAAPGSVASPTSLTSILASVESDLYWVGSDYVAFHALAGKRRAIFYSEFANTGFAPPQEILRRFDPGLTVQPTEGGFFLITPLQTLYNDLSDGAYASVDHLDISLVAPSGRYTSLLDANGLPLLLPAVTAALGPIVEPADDAPTCTRLLAWATDRERIACVANVSNGDGGERGEIRIFDLHPDPARLEATTLQGFCSDDLNDTGSDSCLVKREGYSYGSAQAAGSARALSRSGRYFAFARILPELVYVYFADLDAVPLRIAQPKIFRVDGTNPTPLAFGFSPDERFLLVRRGPRLSIIEPGTGDVGTLAPNLDDAEPCSEDFLASPEAFCGNSMQPSAPLWAADSRTVAFRSTDGLTIVDLAQFPIKDDKVLPASACAAQCSGQFGFQP